MSSLAEVAAELTGSTQGGNFATRHGVSRHFLRHCFTSPSPLAMIAVDVRLCENGCSDLVEQKQTEVVLVLSPRRSSNKSKRWLHSVPVFVPVITFIQVAISVYYVGVMRNDIITIISSPLVFSPFRQTELWRFVTYMFVHDGLAHISLNSLFQILVGLPLESIHGWGRVAIVYTIGGAIGVLIGSNWHPFSYGMGSSGAIFVMLGCLFTTAAFHPDLPSRGIRCGIVMLCFAVILSSVLQAELLFTDQDSTLKTHIAHGNSLIIGIPLAIIFLRVLKHCEEGSKVMIITAILLGCATAVLAIRSFSFYFSVIADMEEPWITYCRMNDDGSLRNDSSIISPSC